MSPNRQQGISLSPKRKRGISLACASGSLLFLLAFPAHAQENAKPDAAADALSLVYFAKKQPVLIRVHVLIDGKSPRAHWNEYVEKWFDYLDANNDGFVDAEEIKRAPTDAIMAQLLQQGVAFPPRGFSLTLATFNKKDSEKLTLADLQEHYSLFAGPIKLIPRSGNANVYNEASEALFKALDQNNDGKLSKEEILAAAKSLRKFDVNGDEWLTLQQLAPRLGNGFMRKQVNDVVMNGDPIQELFHQALPNDTRLPLLLLARYDLGGANALSRENLGLDEATFAKLDTDKDGMLDVNELVRWQDRPGDLEFTINLNRRETVTKLHKAGKVFKSRVQESAHGVYQIVLDDSLIHLLPSTGMPSLARFGEEFDPRAFAQLFRRADVKKQGFVELKDLQGQQHQFLRQAFAQLDWNSDGKLTLQEVQRYVELQKQALDCAVSLSVIDQGRGLFQILDSNGDGRLSPRELLSAWTRLAPFDRGKAGFIVKEDLPRQFHLALQKGPASFGGIPGVNSPRVSRPNLPRGTPEWFIKMDINGDGDVSFAEFLGSREEFERINISGSGLISPEEAIRYDEITRGRKRERR